MIYRGLILLVVFGLLVFTGSGCATKTVTTPSKTIEDAEVFTRGWRAYKNGLYSFALELLTPLAEQGDAGDQDINAAAQYILGLMYVQGLGVDLDYDLAFKWFKLAAEQGETQAQTDLGLMYLNGDGVIQDYEAAVYWFRTAAKSGNHRAQNYYGLMFQLGRGVVQDYDAAFKWFKLAAEHGEVSGQANLGWSYHMGRGATKDNVRAFMWLSYSVSRGLKSAELSLEVVRKDMTDSEIEESQELLIVCRAKEFKGC